MKTALVKKTYILDGQEITQEALIDTAQHCIREQLSTQGDILTESKRTKKYIQVLIGTLECEVFYVLWLNSQHCLIEHGVLFQGTINYAPVFPREMLKAGLAHNAAAVIIAHNHPSGSPEPSSSDIDITQTLKKILDVVEIKLLDHLIIGDSVTSMAERGLL